MAEPSTKVLAEVWGGEPGVSDILVIDPGASPTFLDGVSGLLFEGHRTVREIRIGQLPRGDNPGVHFEVADPPLPVDLQGFQALGMASLRGDVAGPLIADLRPTPFPLGGNADSPRI